jgi:hypothetical protein
MINETMFTIDQFFERYAFSSSVDHSTSIHDWCFGVTVLLTFHRIILGTTSTSNREILRDAGYMK